VKIEDLLAANPKSFHRDIHDNKTVTAISHQQVEHLYQENIHVYEKLLQSKDEQITTFYFEKICKQGK
jgi:hypothetical protein